MDELLLLMAIENLEEIEQDLNNQHRRVFCLTVDHFKTLSNKKFMQMFRLTKQLARDLIATLQPFMEGAKRASAIDIQMKVLIALRFFATGSYHNALQKYFAVSQSTVSRAISEVVNALNNPEVIYRWVRFPSNVKELNVIKNGFYKMNGFPGVIGCIDCMHVAIVTPKKNDPINPDHIYCNSKQYHSIKVQLICDFNLKIINVNARFPGCVRDSHILNKSKVKTVMENIYKKGLTGFYLLGDSGYPLRPWCLTPLETDPPESSPEEKYNNCHKTTRNVIERCNELLKIRFRCLLKHCVLHYTPEVAAKIINGCAVLHNICIENNVPDPETEEGDNAIDFGVIENIYNPDEENLDDREKENLDLANARTIRQQLIANCFT